MVAGFTPCKFWRPWGFKECCSLCPISIFSLICRLLWAHLYHTITLFPGVTTLPLGHNEPPPFGAMSNTILWICQRFLPLQLNSWLLPLIFIQGEVSICIKERNQVPGCKFTSIFPGALWWQTLAFIWVPHVAFLIAVDWSTVDSFGTLGLQLLI